MHSAHSQMPQDARMLHNAVEMGSASTGGVRAFTGSRGMTAWKPSTQSTLIADTTVTSTRAYASPTEMKVLSATGGVSVVLGTGEGHASVSSAQITVITTGCASILEFAAAFRATAGRNVSTTAAATAMASATQRAHVLVTMAGGGVQTVRRANGIAIAMSASALGSASARPVSRELASEVAVSAGQDSPGRTVLKQSPDPMTALRLE